VKAVSEGEGKKRVKKMWYWKPKGKIRLKAGEGRGVGKGGGGGGGHRNDPSSRGHMIKRQGKNRGQILAKKGGDGDGGR